MSFFIQLISILKIYITLVIVITVCWSSSVVAQSGNCDPATPFFNVDLSSDPNGSWISPVTPRIDHCCGATGSERCVEFLVTLSPDAVAINFEVASGANPPGWYYKINCGTQAALGSPICINGPGPYTITVCKPGSNLMQFKITSYAGPASSPDRTVGDGCNTIMSVSGLVTSSITWTSIFPGAIGVYNSYLSCTNACTTSVVTPASGHPAYVDYQVCGLPSAGSCGTPGTFCDTVRVYMSSPILNTVTPNPATFCVNNPTVTLTGTVNGGVAPYTYAWTNAANGSGTVVGNGISYTATAIGTYSFIVYDQNYPDCPPSIVNVPVTSTPLPVVNAGPDKISCATSVNISGTVTGASGGIWSGGSGSFTLGATALTNTYTPTLSELNSGTVVLTLTSTGNGACNPVSDQVTLFVAPPISASISAPSVLCYGQTTTLTANVTGGMGPFTYLWNTGATTQTITTNSAGTYSVTVTGASPGFCTATASATLTANPQIVITTSPNNAVSCTDSASIWASATGGTGTYTYLWSNGATTSTTSVNTGTYAVTVTDGVGCSSTGSVSVTTSSTLAVSVNQPPVICNGTTTTLTATASGGLGGYSYQWNSGATTTSITTGAGNYCVTVTDGGGCIVSGCATITQNSPITVNIPIPATVCNGASATATAAVSGGQAPYTFLWNTGQTTQSLTATAGTYTVTVTDMLNCSNTASVTISQATSLVITPSTVAVGCFGGSNGMATASVSGGTPSYSYAWAPFGGAGATASGLTAGTYSVVVTDAMGCSANATMVVSQPTALSATTTVQNNVSCNGGSNGAATVNPSGGTAPYSYAWSPGGATGQNVSAFSAGTYTVTVTDNKGCTTTVQVTITEPANPLSASIDTTINVSCNGGSNGSATISASGGTPGYSYSWAPGGVTTATATGLAAGSYTVTITDTKSCTFQLQIIISQPTALTSGISNSINVSCNGGNDGSATVLPAGGTNPYTYAWNTSPVQTTATAVNLGAGSYSATVTDAKNCVINSPTVTITQPPVLSVTASPSVFVSCDSAITITSSASGGTGSYSYLWNTGASATSISVNTGSYIIVATDANGCSASDTVSVLATNSTLAVSISQPPNICNGSTIAITATVSGGLGGNSYLWSTGATTASITVGAGSYCVTVTDAGGCIATACVTVVENPVIVLNIATPPDVCPGNTATVTASATGGQPPFTYQWNTGETTQSVIKSAGTYTVTLTDVTGVGCATSANVTITEETPISTTVSHTNVSCFGANNGTVTVYASGGVPAYTYLWTPAGGTNASANHLSPATYTVTITDSLGCTKTDSVTIIQPPSPITMSLTGTNNLCFGDSLGTATAIGNGGAPPYYYFWSIIGDTTNSISNLPAGTYSATVADTTGCYIADTIVIDEPDELVLTATATQIECYGETGSVSLLPTGGTATYTISGDDTVNLASGTYNYTVTDANGCTAITQAIITPGPAPFILTATPIQIACFGGTGGVSLSVAGGVGPVVITGDNTTNLSAGTYNYTATDSTGCTATAQAIITAQPSAVTLTATAFQINCYGQIGSVQLSPTGGTGSFVITGDDTTNLIAGTYTYIATDINGCSDTTQATINPGPAPFALTAVAGEISCYGQTANVSLNTNGGVGVITITGDDTTNLIAGTYNYTATDSTGCTATVQAVIAPGPSPFIITATPMQIACFGETGSVSLSVTGGISPVIITGDDTTNLIAGTYNYTATDSMGCTATAQVIINPAPDSLTVAIAITEVSCFGGTNGTATAIVNGGTSPFHYTWQNADTLASITGLGIGTYSVNIVDDRGCVAADSTLISEPSEIILSGSAIASTCGLNNGSATVNASGGIGTYTYLWSPSGAPNATADSLFADDYTVVVADSNNCQKQMTLTVDSSSFLIADFSATDECLTIPTVFTDSSIASPGSITSWQWNFGDSSPVSNTINPTHLYTSSGNYNISLTVTSSDGCISTVILPVIVHALPTASFISSKVCLNAVTSFSDLSVVTGGDSISTWSWNFGDMTLPAIIKNPNHTYDSSGIYTATLLVASNYGCIDTVSLPVTVYSNPIVQFIVDDSSGCVIHCSQFTDISDTVAGPITNWQWNFGDGSPIGTNPNEEHCYNSVGTYSVSLTVTTTYGCSSLSTQNNIVNVYQSPQAEFSFTPASPTTLTAADIYFDNSSVGASSWVWNFSDINDTAGSSYQFPTHTYSSTGNYCIMLTAQNSYQCADTITHCIEIEPDFTFFIPNAFSPYDSYGVNDGFSGYGTGISKYEMWIFDRWGNMIFYTNNIEVKWNGKANKGKEMAQRDVYVYLIKIEDFKGVQHEYRGTVTLVR